MDGEEQLTQVAESEDSDSSDEKMDNYFLNPNSDKEAKVKALMDNTYV